MELTLNFTPEEEALIKKYAQMEGKEILDFIKDIFFDKIKSEID